MTSQIPTVTPHENFFQRYIHQGLDRVKATWWQVLQAALAASLAYALSGWIWNHRAPFFAAVAAWIIIGFTVEKKVRKVLEMSTGVLFGVLVGEIARDLIGPGVWQIFIVIMLAGLTARFIDRGVVFGVQAGVQSLIAMLLPPSPYLTPFGRFLDALVGVIVAIIVLMLFARDPRRAPRRASIQFYSNLSETLTQLALAAQTGSTEISKAALHTVRQYSQSNTDQWRLANEAADEVARFSPTNHRHSAEIARLRALLVGSDRAMRTTRVVARRQVELHRVTPNTEFPQLRAAYIALVEAVDAVRTSIETGNDFSETRRALRRYCAYLTPETLLVNGDGKQLGRAAHFAGVSLVMQLRSLAVDLLEATGLSTTDAERFLPSLLVVSDGDVVGPRPVTEELSVLEPPTTTAMIESLILGEHEHED